MDKLLAIRLENAIAAGNFEAAQPMIHEYGKSVFARYSSASTLDQRAAILDEALGFLNDRLCLARVMRSHLAAQLERVSTASRYGESQRSIATWQMEG